MMFAIFFLSQEMHSEINAGNYSTYFYARKNSMYGEKNIEEKNPKIKETV